MCSRTSLGIWLARYKGREMSVKSTCLGPAFPPRSTANEPTDGRSTEDHWIMSDDTTKQDAITAQQWRIAHPVGGKDGRTQPRLAQRLWSAVASPPRADATPLWLGAERLWTVGAGAAQPRSGWQQVTNAGKQDSSPNGPAPPAAKAAAPSRGARLCRRTPHRDASTVRNRLIGKAA